MNERRTLRTQGEVIEEYRRPLPGRGRGDLCPPPAGGGVPCCAPQSLQAAQSPEAAPLAKGLCCFCWRPRQALRRCIGRRSPSGCWGMLQVA